MLKSLYLNFHKGGGSCSLSSFLGYTGEGFKCEYSQYGYQVNLPMFQFANIFRLYAQRFGGRVCIMPFEAMVEDINAYLRMLCSRLGEPEVPEVLNVAQNPSYGRYQLALARALNPLFRSAVNQNGLIPGFWLPGTKVFPLSNVLDHRWVHRLF